MQIPVPTILLKQGRAQNLKRGAAIFCSHVSTENIGEDQRKGERELKCSVSTVSLTADMYQIIFQRGGRDPSGPPGYASVKYRVPNIVYVVAESDYKIHLDWKRIENIS